ncbi:hypothetical protein C1886_04665 [Pseudomonas sp. FW300-N1A1]|nr:hypothetical protein C1886_04665 [Pseudomonas sp. FW300-N1A1]
MFKVFVERGKSSNVLMTNFFLGWWGEREAKPIIYIHEIEGVDPGRVISYSVSKDIAQVLTTLQLGHDLEVGTNAQEAFANGMRGFLKLTSRRDVSLARVIAACEWSFDSDSEHVSAMKVVKVCIGLESIYGEDNSEGGLTKSLSDRCAYSLANDVFERKRIMKNCRELYKVRSSIVHGVKRKLSAADSDLLKFGMEILTGSIDKEVTLLPD